MNVPFFPFALAPARDARGCGLRLPDMAAQVTP
jgi:hypothetical protein